MRNVTRPTRGLFIRLSGLLLGFVVASGLVVGIASNEKSAGLVNEPLGHPVLIHSSLTQSLSWPQQGSAAIEIPALGFSASENNDVLPIASLTKLMTAYLVLKALPLTPGASGPCWTVSSSDADLYHSDASTDQSSVVVVPGEQLCELQVLEGMTVHSASNFSTIAVELVNRYASTSLGLSTPSEFLSAMNETASQLGMTHTTYVDYSGYSPGDVSTASDLLKITNLLMNNPVFSSIASMTSVTLPYAGTVGTFTPELSQYGVFGVKSGRTSAAGGCDVMARTVSINNKSETMYVVVLGQQSGDVLASAGEAALALGNSLANQLTNTVIPKNTVAGHLRLGHRMVSYVTAKRTVLKWWMVEGDVRETVDLNSSLTKVRKGERIGTLRIRGSHSYEVPLVSTGSLSGPSLLERLR